MHTLEYEHVNPMDIVSESHSLYKDVRLILSIDNRRRTGASEEVELPNGFASILFQSLIRARLNKGEGT